MKKMVLTIGSGKVTNDMDGAIMWCPVGDGGGIFLYAYEMTTATGVQLCDEDFRTAGACQMAAQLGFSPYDLQHPLIKRLLAAGVLQFMPIPEKAELTCPSS